MKNKTLILIMTGGLGTRLWPLTSNKTPKAFLSFDNSGISLLSRTISRSSKIVPHESIFLVAGETHRQDLENHTGLIPFKNIILEPVGRSTLPCISLAGLYMRRFCRDCVMAVMPGEQLIENEDEFKKLIHIAAEIARKNNSIVTLGIKPDNPATRFGYIKMGKKVERKGDAGVFKVSAFTEKPDKQKAVEFIESGRYLWNSGIFVFPVNFLFDMIEKFTPDIHKILGEIDKNIGTDKERKTIERNYPHMPDISIDYAIMEKADSVLVIPASIGWNDMGTWPEVAETWSEDKQSNSVWGKHISLDSRSCIIYNPDKVVATIGLENIIIVETQDAILVCSRDRSDDVKKLVKRLEEV
ncbi:mannose-1-phosphate guanylyltransferase [Candidatus Poribacteria bacterium]|nr:mannose-1-phosphate guanylyltransferase [Candidatus Poribacteria bacterium]